MSEVAKFESPFRTVVVVGAGTMGSWIAAEIAAAGFATQLVDTNAVALERTRAAHAAKGVSGVTYRESVEAFGEAHGAALIIETIVEDLEAKKALFRTLTERGSSETVVATNTSILLLEDFAAGLPGPERMAHLHFLRPRTAVEIMPGPATSEATLASLESFARDIGEVPVRLRRAQRGYVFGAVMGPMLDAAIQLAVRDVAEPRTIDMLMQKILETPWGPFLALDIVGLDVSLRIRENKLAMSPGDETLKTCIAYLRAKVEKGELGQKSGKGFYDWPPKG